MPRRKPTARATAAAKRFMRTCKTSDAADDVQQELESLESQLETLESHMDGVQDDVDDLKFYKVPRTDLKHLRNKFKALRSAFGQFKSEVSTAVYDAQEASDLLNMKEQGFDLT